MNTLAERLQSGLDRVPGRTQADLARYCGVSTATVSNWFDGKILSLKAENLRTAARYLGCDRDWLATGIGLPHWTNDQHSPEGSKLRGASVAHILSEPPPSYVVLKWEDIMTLEKLPREFVVTLLDDSMSPRARAGDQVRFMTGIDPRPDDGVLVQDATGHCYFRQYKLRRPGSWQAHAVNEAFLALDSDTEQLTLLAVMVGLPSQRWG